MGQLRAMLFSCNEKYRLKLLIQLQTLIQFKLSLTGSKVVGSTSFEIPKLEKYKLRGKIHY